MEKPDAQPVVTEPGLIQFLENRSLSGDATTEEIEFLERLKFRGRQPTPLYYYREMQNLRDPLHFGATRTEGESALYGRRSRMRPGAKRRERKPESVDRRSEHAI
jgi:hypothetical protein